MRSTPRLLPALLIVVFMLPVPLAFADEDPPGDLQALIDAENDRKNALSELARSHKAPPAPALPAAPAESCGQPHARLVDVATSAQLADALRDALPGDQIRLADGVYRGTFHIAASGSATAPITLCGSRAAIIDAGSRLRDYGLHLEANHWVLAGFTIRNALKGLVTDNASHNVLRSLEVHTTGHEGIHLRGGSSDNLVERVWVHDTGQVKADFGEGIYIGSAASNWGAYGGAPDFSDRNRVVGSVLGPNVAAEGIDIKEGTSNGEVRDSFFVTRDYRAADSWVDLKGNGYRISNLTGLRPASKAFKRPVTVQSVHVGWGERNEVRNIHEQPAQREEGEPFRALHADRLPATMVLPARSLPYTLAELRVRFPASLAAQAPGVMLLREHLLAAKDTTLTFDSSDFHELRLLSEPQRFTSIVGYMSRITITGTSGRPLVIRSWQPTPHRPDRLDGDGRAYVLMHGGRMDMTFAALEHLGFGTGQTSGAAWRGTEKPHIKARGDVVNTRFEGNYFGAFTFEAEAMRWIDNIFANNLHYGFDPHDFSNNFLVQGNSAYGNGSHGIIFSRGCDNNIMRANRSFNNDGHGIMIDDGKVKDDGDPRHAKAVPSSNNIIENNQLWGNEVGIVLEGGDGNIARANQISNNGYGVRITDAATDSEISGNTIRASRQFGVFVYDGAKRSRIVNNTIALAKSAVVLRSGPNTVEGNTISQISGQGIVLSGDQSGSAVSANVIAGRGLRPISILEAQGIAPADIANNAIGAWETLGPRRAEYTLMGFMSSHPATLFWVIVFGLPLLMWLPSRLTSWGSPRRRAVAASPPAGE
jgi:parallel beta-helix repeat protein